MPQFVLNSKVTNNIADNLQGFNEAYRGYIEAIYFTDTGDSEQPAADIEMAVESQLKCLQDVAEFIGQVEQAGLLSEYLDQPTASWNQLGVDYWFTRQGHGCGFWDRDMGELGDRLTDLAKFCGSADTYEGDDGLLYV
jgi:hypothetical protein